MTSLDLCPIVSPSHLIVEGSINAAELSVRREAARELARSQENPDLRQAEEGTDGDTNQGDDERKCVCVCVCGVGGGGLLVILLKSIQ